MPGKLCVVVLERGPLRLEIKTAPFRIHLRRDGRRLVRHLGVWCCEGEVRDRFVQVTEGVIAEEARGFPEHAIAFDLVAADDHAADLRVHFNGGRMGLLRLALTDDATLAVQLTADGDPLRLAVAWDGRAEERFNGLGAHHALRVDLAGKDIQLGADRRYTGPACPPEMLELGGVPQGDYAPAPWLQSSRGYAVWLQGYGNGTRFDLGDRTTISTRSAAGPLRAQILCDPSPAARLRRYLRRSGMPALLPEWGYGFWKSRDVYPHQDDVMEDVHGCRWHGIPLDAVVLDSPWETQYNTWEFNPYQFPDAPGMVRGLRARGVRTVVWVTPWVNLDSFDGQIPPDPGSQRLHRAPASNYDEGRRAGHFLHDAEGDTYVARWWMGTGSPVDFTNPRAERWWREQAKATLRLGVTGIKADDGEGYYLPDDLQLHDGRRGAEHAWEYGQRYRESMQRALDEVHPGDGMLFGRSGWSGQQRVGMLWAGDQISDLWSLRALVACTISAASSGFSNWSHDVGGYLGHALVDRCPKEILLRWVQLGCFTPLMQAHGRLQQEPWTYDPHTLDVYRGYVLLHEQLVPYIRAAAATAARCGLPITRPLPLLDPADERGWGVADAFGFGPALWVAPVLEEGATSREVQLPRGDWIEAWSGRPVRGGREVEAEVGLDGIPVYVREGSIVVTYPADHVASGLGDTPEDERPLEATLWGEPACGRAAVRLADGTRIAWRDGVWTCSAERDVRVSPSGPRKLGPAVDVT
ncbi:hypothetical protein LRS13_13025 [Svornostia abyssi]|uniref:Uncharacterized protein n=1 Tax=Svornostia abyssi TaxID=2898438 RepID=A0ABY5PAM7_9ACTN|nr:hypothetical protein LRS13_13025 [Parviterribacteraceae bacterium J379]